MSNALNAFIWLLVLSFLAFICWLLYSNYKVGNSTIDHHRLDETHDGISESYAPIPAWWAFGMWISILFAVIYLVLYPGLGYYQGLLGWSADKAYAESYAVLGKKLDQTLLQYANVNPEALSQDRQAMLLGRRIFRDNCSVCHGRNGMGTTAFPNLADDDWLYGGSADAIKTTLVQGRKAMMPAWKGSLSQQQIEALSQWLSNGSQAELAQKTYQQSCAACHGADRQGNIMLGAPNIADDIWLYGGSVSAIRHTLENGRQGVMPAQKDLLSTEKIHLLTAYVMSLSSSRTHE